MLRRAYNWVLHWADTPYGTPALFAIAFAESSFFPIPPDVLLIALAIAIPARSLWFAAICLAGSLSGAFLGYALGYWGWDTIGQPIIDFYDGAATMTWISAQYERYGFWGILVAALTPIPYKVFTIASGVFRFDLPTFFFASLVGRGIRFFAVAGLITYFGPAIKDFIDRRFNLVAVIFSVLLIGGLLVLKLLI